MNRLFWKIFFSFWMFMVLLGISSALLTAQLLRSSEQDRPVHLKPLMMHLRRIVAQGGEYNALSDWLRSINEHHPDLIYILDRKQQDLLNRKTPGYLLQRYEKGEKFGRPKAPQPLRKPWRYTTEPPAMRREHIWYKQFSTYSGVEYVLLVDHEKNAEHWKFLRSLNLGSRILLGTLLCGIICFFLSRYLTVPLQKLRLATRKIAEGDQIQFSDAELLLRKDEIGDLGRDFSLMTERVNSMLTAQQRLLRDVSHELRSPLARLQIAVGLARQRSEQKIEPELDRIENEAERLNELIGQALILAKLSTPTQALQKQEIDLKNMLQMLVRDADYEARQKKCRVILQNSSEQRLEGNWDLLYSGLENILRNAVQYTRNASEVLVDSATHFEGEQTSVCITIRDHGSGIVEEELDKIYTAFYRVDEARTSKCGGYGIGLAIAERAISLHGGNIKAENAVGGGLLVSIILPMR